MVHTTQFLAFFMLRALENNPAPRDASHGLSYLLGAWPVVYGHHFFALYLSRKALDFQKHEAAQWLQAQITNHELVRKMWVIFSTGILKSRYYPEC